MARSKDPQLEERRKDQLIHTAFLCLVEGSHGSMTLEQVGRLAGFSKGMVTYYFASKGELILETIRWYLRQQQEALLAIVHSEAPVRERLERLVAVALPSRDECAREVRFQSEVWSFGKERPEALEAIRVAYSQFRQACQEMIRVGVEEGYVRARDPEELYVILHSLMDGLTFQVVLDTTLDPDRLRTRAVELLERTLTADEAPTGEGDNSLS